MGYVRIATLNAPKLIRACAPFQVHIPALIDSGTRLFYVLRVVVAPYLIGGVPLWQAIFLVNLVAGFCLTFLFVVSKIHNIDIYKHGYRLGLQHKEKVEGICPYARHFFYEGVPQLRRERPQSQQNEWSCFLHPPNPFIMQKDSEEHKPQ